MIQMKKTLFVIFVVVLAEISLTDANRRRRYCSKAFEPVSTVITYYVI